MFAQEDKPLLPNKYPVVYQLHSLFEALLRSPRLLLIPKALGCSCASNEECDSGDVGVGGVGEPKNLDVLGRRFLQRWAAHTGLVSSFFMASTDTSGWSPRSRK